MRHASSRRWVRLVLGCFLAFVVAGVAITSAAGDDSSVAPQRLCTGGPRTIDGVPRAQCLAEFIPVKVQPTAVKRAAVATPATGACPEYFEQQGQGKSPCELLRAYNLPGPSSHSATQVIGIVDAYDNPDIFSELTEFDSGYGIASISQCGGGVTQSCFEKVNQTGGTTPPSPPPSNDDWKPEISLDVESAHAVCPNCKILLVEATNDSVSNLAAAVATAKSLGATEISNSYGIAESSASQSLYNSFAAEYDNGVPTFVSAGDDGWAPAFPADVPAVISVGGTTLTTSDDYGGTRGSETVWGDGNVKKGTGSGCSAFASAKPWQPMTSGWSATGCGTKRSIADVSAVANPDTGLIIYTEDGWYQYGGTSLAAPLIAAIYALAANGTTPSAPVETAYWNTDDFFDVTSGSNGSCGKTACNAGVGYDGPTGIGTPDGVSGFAPENTSPSVSSFAPTAGSIGASVTVTGAFIGDATSVKLNGKTATFSALSGTQLKVTVPTGATSGTFEITTPDGTADSSDSFTVGEALPTIKTFTPAKGVQGTSVKVTGTSLDGTTDADVNGTAASFSITSATALTVVVPAGATTGPISVTNAAGTATTLTNFAITPKITSFAPTSGIVGSTFDITGTGLAGVTAGTVGGKAAGVVVNSDTSATLTVPSGAATGKVTLTGPGGTATSTASYTVIPPPAISSFAPAAAVEGASVKVTGTHLTGATEVTLGGADVTVTNNTATSLTFTVPADAIAGRIAITTATGTGTSSGTLHITPKIASFAPTSGIVGSTFDVMGTGLNGVTSAKVNTTAALITVHDDTSAR